MPERRVVARQQGNYPYPPPSQAENLACPRCESTKTKFCYYNNYNLSQPRYFCKACRRYWTQGGNLRNIPVGGGTRKRPRTSISPGEANRVSSSTSVLSSEGPAGFRGLAGYEVTPLDEMGQYGRGIWEEAAASGWAMNDELVDGECFLWPELASASASAQQLK